MSLNRFNPRRDENEPEIRKRFAYHGWHTEQVSGKGMPDLLVWPPAEQWIVEPVKRDALATGSRLVDVKMPKGKLKPAQEKKWSELAEKGIPVYVVRTLADVDALVRGELKPWEPIITGSISAPRPHANVRREPATPRPRLGAPVRKPSPNHVAPRGSRTWPMATTAVVPSAEDSAAARAVLVALEAEKTFAPGPSAQCGCRLGVLCGLHRRKP